MAKIELYFIYYYFLNELIDNHLEVLLLKFQLNEHQHSFLSIKINLYWLLILYFLSRLRKSKFYSVNNIDKMYKKELQKMYIC